MVRENDFVAIFHSIHRVMKAEKVLKKARAEVVLIPVPRQLASDCGLALRFAPEHRQRVEELLEQAELPASELYQRQGGEYRRIV